MRSKLKRVVLILTLAVMALCVAGLVACNNKKGGSGSGNSNSTATYSVVVTGGDAATYQAITAQWKSGETVVGSSKLNSSGRAAAPLKQAEYTVTLTGFPAGYAAEPASRQVDAKNRTANFTLVTVPIPHDVSVSVTAPSGMDVPSGLQVQLYKDGGTVGSPVDVTGSSASITAPDEGDYTAKLLGLPDYFTATDQSISTDTTSISFELSLTQVAYKVEVDAPAGIIDQIKVDFFNAGGPVSGATGRGVPSGEVTIDLLAGDYTVRLSNLPEGYAADKAEVNLTVSDRTAQFVVAATFHSVEVSIANDTGVEINNLQIQLYDGEDPVGNAINVSNGASVNVPKGDYTVKLLGLPDYLQANEPALSTASTSIAFTLSLKVVEYTVEVEADASLLSSITVTFYKEGVAVQGATALALEDGSVTCELLAGTYTVSLNNVPETYSVTPESATLTMSNRQTTFKVEEEATTHKVTVTVTAASGVTLPAEYSVQLYSGNDKVDSPVSVIGNTATLYAPLDGTYTAKLEGLPDYLQAAAQSIAPTQDSITFTVDFAEVDYTVTVTAPEEALSGIKVTFSKEGSTVAGDLSLTGNQLVKTLTAGNYTVTITVGYGYEVAGDESVNLTAISRTAEFTVVSVMHNITVNITTGFGVTLPNDLKVQLFDDEEPVGEAIPVTNGATVSVLKGNYTLKLTGTGIGDYLVANDVQITATSATAEFTVTNRPVDYVITVYGPAEALAETTVTFKQNNKVVETVPVVGNTASVSLPAGPYLVTVNVPNGFVVSDEGETDLTSDDRTHTFTVSVKMRPVTFSATGVNTALLSNAQIQLYDGETAYGNPVAYTAGSIDVPDNGKDYSIKFVNLPSYLSSEGATVAAGASNVLIAVTAGNVEYTVKVIKDSSFVGDFDTITVTFYKNGAPVAAATDLRIDEQGEAKATLPADIYTVKLTGSFDAAIYGTDPDTAEARPEETAQITLTQTAHYVQVSIENNAGNLFGSDFTLELYAPGNTTNRADERYSNINNGSQVRVPFGNYTAKLTGNGIGSYLEVEEEQSVTSATGSITFAVGLMDIKYTVTVKAPSNALETITVTFSNGSGDVEGAKDLNVNSSTGKLEKTLPAGSYMVTINNVPSSCAADSTTLEVTHLVKSVTFNVSPVLAAGESVSGISIASVSNGGKISTKVLLADTVGAGRYVLSVTKTSGSSSAQRAYVSLNDTSNTLLDFASDGVTSSSSWTIPFIIDDDNQHVIYLYMNMGEITATIALEKTVAPTIDFTGVDTVTKEFPISIGSYNSGSLSVDLIGFTAGNYEMITSGTKVYGPVTISIDYTTIVRLDSTLSTDGLAGKLVAFTLPEDGQRLNLTVDTLDVSQTPTIKFTFNRKDNGGGEEDNPRATLSVTTPLEVELIADGTTTLVPLSGIEESGSYKLTFKIKQNNNVFWNNWFLNIGSDVSIQFAYSDGGFDNQNKNSGSIVIVLPAGCKRFTLVSTGNDRTLSKVELSLEFLGGVLAGEDENNPIIVSLDKLVGEHTASGLSEAYFLLPQLETDEVQYVITFDDNVSVTVKGILGGYEYIGSGSVIELGTISTTMIKVTASGGADAKFTIAEKETGGGSGIRVEFNSNYGSYSITIDLGGVPDGDYMVVFTFEDTLWGGTLTFTSGSSSFEFTASFMGADDGDGQLHIEGNSITISSGGGVASCVFWIELIPV